MDQLDNSDLLCPKKTLQIDSFKLTDETIFPNSRNEYKFLDEKLLIDTRY